MLEETLTLALILLIGTHAHLIRRCTSLEGQIPVLTEGISTKADDLEGTVLEVRNLLDEALDYINELPAATPPILTQSGEAESIPSMILSSLLSRMSMPPPNASPTEPQQWEILQSTQDDTPTQDNQPITSGPAVFDR